MGGRVVESLLQHPGLGEVVPTVRRWSTLARIGRFPIHARQLDILDAEQARNTLSGVDTVIHCAVGGREATVQGTENLLSAARANGVRRFVHVSTMDVYGREEGVLDERSPLVTTGRAYGDSKIEAETRCRHHGEKGLEVVILRPTIVYGPFSDLWTIEFAERLGSGSWTLPREACQGICNLVYVDDLVRAILLSVDAPDAPGHAFNINGPDRPTWQGYVEALNAAMGLPPLTPPNPTRSRVRSALVEPARASIKVIYRRFEDPILTLYKRSRLARRLMKGVQGSLQRVPSPAEYDLYGRRVDVRSIEAESRLGYRPVTTMEEGIRASARWLEHEGAFHAGT